MDITTIWGSREAYNIGSLKSINTSSLATLIDIRWKSVYRAANIITFLVYT